MNSDIRIQELDGKFRAQLKIEKKSFWGNKVIWENIPDTNHKKMGFYNAKVNEPSNLPKIPLPAKIYHSYDEAENNAQQWVDALSDDKSITWKTVRK